MKRTKGKTPRVDVSIQDQRSARTAEATANLWVDRGNGKADFSFRSAEVTVEAYGDGGAFVTFRIHSGTDTTKIRHVTITMTDAELSDLPVIALALTAALKEGVKTGSFPALEGLGEAK